MTLSFLHLPAFATQLLDVWLFCIPDVAHKPTECFSWELCPCRGCAISCNFGHRDIICRYTDRCI